MPIAKPAAIEKILYHIANLRNEVRDASIKNEAVYGHLKLRGQQNLPLYSESVMKDFDQVTGAMSEGKLSNIAENLVSPEDFKKVSDVFPVVDKGTAWSLYPQPQLGFKGGIAIPERNLLEYGATNIPHEGRHLEVLQKKYGEGQPVFQEEVKYGEKQLLAVPPQGEASSQWLGPLADYKNIHHELTLDELDAAMSEIGTLVKAGVDLRKPSKRWYGDPRIQGDMKRLWNILPPDKQQHYIETAAIAGIAAPSIGAFQPETKNR